MELISVSLATRLCTWDSVNLESAYWAQLSEMCVRLSEMTGFFGRSFGNYMNGKSNQTI